MGHFTTIMVSRIENMPCLIGYEKKYLLFGVFVWINEYIYILIIIEVSKLDMRDY